MKTEITKRFEVKVRHADDDGDMVVTVEGDMLDRTEGRCDDSVHIMRDGRSEAMNLTELLALADLARRAMREVHDHRDFCLTHVELYESHAPDYACPKCVADKKPEPIASVIDRALGEVAKKVENGALRVAPVPAVAAASFKDAEDAKTRAFPADGPSDV